MSRFYSRGRVEKDLAVRSEDDDKNNNNEDNASPETQDIDGESITQKDDSGNKDYIDVPSRPHILKVLNKQGDKTVLFADKVLKFTGSGKMKRRIFLITDFAIYIVDPDTDTLKRRIALAAVERLCLSELGDNFLAIIIPTEYDVLIASTRKTEIVNALVDATKSASDYELDVVQTNRFTYNAAADLVKEVQFEDVEGGVRTRTLQKQIPLAE